MISIGTGDYPELSRREPVFLSMSFPLASAKTYKISPEKFNNIGFKALTKPKNFL